MLDRVTEIEPQSHVKGLKCWTLTDDVFDDHFPGMPVVPGTHILESMAQLLGFLIDKSFGQAFPEEGSVYPILSMIHKAKFRSHVIPGDRMEIVGELKTLDRQLATGKASGFVDGIKKAEANFSFYLIPSRKIDNQRLAQERKEFYDFLTNGLEIDGLKTE